MSDGHYDAILDTIGGDYETRALGDLWPWEHASTAAGADGIDHAADAAAGRGALLGTSLSLSVLSLSVCLELFALLN